MIRTILLLHESMQHFIDLLEILIWPLTLLCIILLFKKNFQNVFNRLASIDASTSGISMTFKELAKEAHELAEDVVPLAIAKSGIKIGPSRNQDYQSPREIVRAVQSDIESLVRQMAKDKGMPTENSSLNDITQRLEDTGAIDSKHRKLIDRICRLIAISDQNVTAAQAKQINDLRNALIKD